MIDRRAVCAGLGVAISRPSVARRRDGDETMLIFADPLDGDGRRFAAWWQQQLRALADAPGIRQVSDYRRAAIRLRAGIEPLPPFLAYVVLSSLSKALQPLTRLVNALPTSGSNGGKKRTIFYADGGRWNAADHKVDGQRYLQIVLADAVAGKQADYERWFAEHHGPELAAVPGVSSVALGLRRDLPPQLRFGRDAPAYLSAMSFQSASIGSFKERLERAAKTTIRPTDTYDLDHAWRETYVEVATYRHA